MATKLPMQQAAAQQERKFLSHPKRSSGHGGGGDGETYTEQDDGSIARSSLDLSQELRVAQGCFFSSSLKRGFKAFCGRLGKWSMSQKKSPSSLYQYLHLNVPLDPLLSPLLVYQKQKSKSRQSLLDHSIEDSHLNLPLDLHFSSLAFHKQKSKSKLSLLDHPFGHKEHSHISPQSKSKHSLLDHHYGLQEHAHMSDHEDIKDIHLDPQGITFTTRIDGIKNSSLDLHEETKPEECHHHQGGDYHNQHRKISRIDVLEKKNDTHLASIAKQSLIEEQSQSKDLASPEGLKHQSEVLTGIHALMLGVTHSFELEAKPLITISDEKSTSSTSLQLQIPKSNMHLPKPKPRLGLQGTNTLMSVNNQENIIRPPLKSDYTSPRVHDVDDILSSLATHVFSLRNQAIRGGFGGVHYSPLQGKEAIRQHGMNFNDYYENGDAYDAKKSIASLISSRKFEDLADLEEFLQCYMSLNSPCFLDMVNRFLREICNDIFECEGWFENKNPFIST